MLFSNRTLIKIALPLLIQQVLIVTVGMVDTVMVSYTGDAAVSGVSLVNSLDNMLCIVLFSLTTGGTVVISQMLGSKKIEAAKGAVKQLLYVSALVVLAVKSVVFFLRKQLLVLLFGNVEASVMDSAEGYFFYILLSLPFLAVQSACSAAQRAEGKTVVILLVSVGANLVNIAGNTLLIVVFELGAAGAAMATLASRIVAAVVMVFVIQNPRNILCVNRLLHYRPDMHVIREIMRLGIPNGIEDGMFSFGKLVTQSLIATMPTPVITANAVANALTNYQYMPGTAISGTILPVVGRCIGACEKEQAKAYLRRLVGWGYICLWTVIVGTVLWSDSLVGLYKLEDVTAQIAKQLIFYHAIAAGVLWPIAFILPSGFRATGDVKFSLGISLLSMWLFRVALAYFLSLEQVRIGIFALPGKNMGIAGVWVAMSVDWGFRTVLFLIHYWRGKWLHIPSTIR